MCIIIFLKITLKKMYDKIQHGYYSSTILPHRIYEVSGHKKQFKHSFIYCASPQFTFITALICKKILKLYFQINMTITMNGRFQKHN